ncbi:MAG: DUF924 domain-containing protein [Deltaproteobacteria bacterium]|nr:MAG: DUF924 domain-containing protein [Deltaproteobacteria bacterium]
MDQTVPHLNIMRDLGCATRGSYDAWLETPQGKLAYVLLLDQFPRNIFRGTPQAFAYDALALHVAKQAMATGDEQALLLFERLFVYLPVTHRECLADQTLGVERIATLACVAPADQVACFAEHLRMARLHQQAVARFGRLPSRKALLKRASSAEETVFLTDPDHLF